MPAWQRRAARASHAALYALMLALPLSGWLMASASPTQDLLQMQNLVFGRWPLPDPFVPGVARVEAAAHAVHTDAADRPRRAARAPRRRRPQAPVRRPRPPARADDLRPLRTKKPRPGRDAAIGETTAAAQAGCGAFRPAMNWSNSAWSLAARSWSRKLTKASRSSSSRLQGLLAVGVEGGVAGAAHAVAVTVMMAAPVAAHALAPDHVDEKAESDRPEQDEADHRRGDPCELAPFVEPVPRSLHSADDCVHQAPPFRC